MELDLRALPSWVLAEPAIPFLVHLQQIPSAGLGENWELLTVSKSTRKLLALG